MAAHHFNRILCRCPILQHACTCIGIPASGPYFHRCYTAGADRNHRRGSGEPRLFCSTVQPSCPTLLHSQAHCALPHPGHQPADHVSQFKPSRTLTRLREKRPFDRRHLSAGRATRVARSRVDRNKPAMAVEMSVIVPSALDPVSSIPLRPDVTGNVKSQKHLPKRGVTTPSSPG